MMNSEQNLCTTHTCIICRAHAAELGNAVPEKPILFLKPTTAYISEGKHIKVCRV